MRKMTAWAACGLLVACFAGCKNPAVNGAPVAPAAATPGEPKWVSTGARAFPEDAGKALYGVGVGLASRFPNDPWLLRQGATACGSAAISRQIKAAVAAAFKSYAEAAFKPGAQQGQLQGLIENAAESVRDAMLGGAAPAATWTNPQTGDVYVLVKLDIAGLPQQVREKIIAAEKDRLKMGAAAAHKELDRIIEDEMKKLR